MTDHRPTQTTTLILARTMVGAQAAARLVDDDALSIVDDGLSDETRTRTLSGSYAAVLVECTTEDVPWLTGALDLATSVVRPGASIRLVVGDGNLTQDLVEPIADALAGWVITGVAVDGDVLSLGVSPATAESDRRDTVASLEGAFRIEAALRVVKDPAAHDLDEFEYRSSLMASYLSEVPRLHAEIESLNSQLKELRASANQALENADLPRHDTEGEQPVKPPTVDSGQRVRDGRRIRKIGMVAAAGLSWAVLAGLATAAWDLTSTGFLTLLVLGAVIASALDARRRAKTLLGAARQASAGVKAVKGIGRTLAKHQSQTVRAVRDTTAHHAQATQRHTTQVGTQVTSGIASSARAVVGQVTQAIDTSTDRAARQATERSANQTSQILKAVPRTADFRTAVRAELLTAYQQLEANLQLRDLVDVSGPTPQLRGWAASPDVLVFLIQEMRRLNPRLVLECGSGASTVWLAMAARSAGLQSRIVALEHDVTFATETVRLLSECGVADIAEVRVAPLEETNLNGQTVSWYARSSLQDLDGIGLLFVDGPPGTISRHARYPALPILRPMLTGTAVIVLDDVIRETEQEIADLWASEFPELRLDTLKFEKGAAVFRLGIGDTDAG